MLLLLLLVLVPVIELYVIIQVGQELGAVVTILLLLGTSVLGAALLRREGSRAYRHFVEATEAGRIPTREVADGLLVLLGGLLLLVPGFVSDVLGLLLLLPPTRALLRRPTTGLVARRLLGPAGAGFGPAFARRRRAGRPDDDVIDGEVVHDAHDAHDARDARDAPEPPPRALD